MLNPNEFRDLLISNSPETDLLLEELMSIALIDQKNKENLIEVIANYLDRDHTFLRGIQYLNFYIQYATEDEIIDNIKTLSRVFDFNDSLYFAKEVKFNTIAKLIILAGRNPRFKEKFSQYIPHIVENCLEDNYSENDHIAALNCLGTILKFNETVNSVSLENKLIKVLDCPLPQIVKKGSKAFLYLQQTGLPQAQIKNFHKKITKLIETAHNIMIEIIDPNENVNESDCFKFPTYKMTPEVKEKILVNRFRNCLIYLKTFLSSSYSVNKEINLQKLLKLIFRGLSKHCCGSKADFSNLDVLLAIQEDLLDLLHNLIDLMQMKILPFFVIICDKLVEYILTRKSCKCFEFNEGIVKLKASKLLCEMPFELKMHLSKLEHMCYYLNHDLSPVRAVLTLTTNIPVTPGKSKKIKGKPTKNSNFRSDSQYDMSKHDIKLKEKFCVSSAQLLAKLLETKLPGRKQNSLKSIYTSLIKNIESINLGITLPPYNSPNCQKVLYELLLKFHQLRPALVKVNHSINLFLKGSKSTNFQIATFCYEALNYFNILYQPTGRIFFESNDDQETSIDFVEHHNVVEKCTESNLSLVQSNDKIRIIENRLVAAPIEAVNDAESVEVCEDDVSMNIDSDNRESIIEIYDGLSEEEVKSSCSLEVSEEDVTLVLESDDSDTPVLDPRFRNYELDMALTAAEEQAQDVDEDDGFQDIPQEY